MSLAHSNPQQLAKEIAGLLGNAGTPELAEAMAKRLWEQGVRTMEDVRIDDEFFDLAERLDTRRTDI